MFDENYLQRELYDGALGTRKEIQKFRRNRRTAV